MKLVTIKNKFIFKPDPKNKTEVKKYKPNEAHIYAAYTDPRTKEQRLVQTTHVIEPRKKKDIKRGNIMLTKLPNVDMPSGVKSEYFNRDVNGDPIDLKRVQAKNITGKAKKATYVRKSLAEKIISFAKKRHK